MSTVRCILLLIFQLENLKFMTKNNAKEGYTWTDVAIGTIQVTGTFIAAYGMWHGASKVMTHKKAYSMDGLPVVKLFGTHLFDGLEGYFQRGNDIKEEYAQILETLTKDITYFGSGNGLSDVHQAYSHCVNKIADFKVGHVWNSMKSTITPVIPENLIEAVNDNKAGTELFADYTKELSPSFVEAMSQYANGVFTLQKEAASKVNEGYTEIVGSVVVGGVSGILPNLYNKCVDYIYGDSE
jgi:hypothetical protein